MSLLNDAAASIAEMAAVSQKVAIGAAELNIAEAFVKPSSSGFAYFRAEQSDHGRRWLVSRSFSDRCCVRKML